MRVMHLRLTAWFFAALLFAVALLRSGGSPATDAGKTTQTAHSPIAAPPALFQAEGPVHRITKADAIARPVKDSQLRAANVIREPGMPVIDDPEIERPKSYRIEEPVAGRNSLPPVPVELLLNPPKPEPSPIAPRVSQNVPEAPSTAKEEEFESSSSMPLPVLSSNDPAMQPVNDAAAKYVQRGFALGERSAVYAARTEFIQALRTIAQAVDAQAGLPPKHPHSCSYALARGLAALEEAGDFAPSGSRLDGNLDLKAIVAAHRTPAAKDQRQITQLAAMQLYFDFAREQLVRAAAGNPVASQALTGLGKTYTVSSEKAAHRLAGAKAMVFHQAAVEADPANHLAANELGVLLAQYGQWQPAKQAFLQSLRVRSDAAAWQNLSAVHLRLGEQELAALAQKERSLLLKGSTTVPTRIDGRPTVEWVDPQAFAGPPEDVQQMPKVATKPAAKTAAAPPKASDSWSWLPWR